MPVKIIAGMTLIMSIIAFILFGKIQSKKQSDTRTLKVTTSFYPLAFLAETIGGASVLVTNLTPPGAEPHDFEPSTRTIAELENQDIVLLNGGGLEGYENKFKANINLRKTALVITGESLMSISKDPHIWLDPVLYKKEAEIITKAFVQKDPINATEYSKNMQNLARELDILDVEYKNGLRDCKQKSIITSHKAFGYLAKRYNLNEVALTGLSPEEEPSSKTLADVATFAKTNKIGYIFFEELVSPAIAETIAIEVGVQTLVLNPLEGLTNENREVGKTYLSIQRENLKNLQIALECN